MNKLIIADIPADGYALLVDTWNPKNFDADKIVRLFVFLAF